MSKNSCLIELYYIGRFRLRGHRPLWNNIGHFGTKKRPMNIGCFSPNIGHFGPNIGCFDSTSAALTSVTFDQTSAALAQHRPVSTVPRFQAEYWILFKKYQKTYNTTLKDHLFGMLFMVIWWAVTLNDIINIFLFGVSIFLFLARSSLVTLHRTLLYNL